MKMKGYVLCEVHGVVSGAQSFPLPALPPPNPAEGAGHTQGPLKEPQACSCLCPQGAP